VTFHAFVNALFLLKLSLNSPSYFLFTSLYYFINQSHITYKRSLLMGFGVWGGAGLPHEPVTPSPVSAAVNYIIDDNKAYDD